MTFSTTSIGVAAGLACALSQTAAYIFSRLFVLRSRSAVMHLLLFSHAIMGVVAVIGLACTAPLDLPPLRVYANSLMAATGFFVFGQIGLLSLMRITSPSGIAPLLGLKIIVLAFLNLILFGENLRMPQWGAVVLCASAALILNAAGAKLSKRLVLLVLFTCSGYSLSDLGISQLVQHLGEPGSITAALKAAFLCYALLGAFSVIVIAIQRPRCDWRAFRRFGIPYTILWFFAMLVLFLSISSIGPVYATILQSTRGLWSVLAGAAIGYMGLVHVEARMGRFSIARRILAALMMVTAIWLYSRA